MAWDFTGGFSSSGAGQNNSTAAGWDFSGGFKFDPEKEKKKKDLEQSVQQLVDELFVPAPTSAPAPISARNPLLEALNSMTAESSTPFVSPRMEIVNAGLDDYQKSMGDSEIRQIQQAADLLPVPVPKDGIYARADKAMGGVLPFGVPIQREEGFPGMEDYIGGGPEAPPVFPDDPVMKSLAMGWGDVAQSAGGAAKWMGKKSLGDKWVQAGQKLIDANQLTPGTPGEYGLGLSVVRSMPFTAALVPAGLAGAAGGAAAAGAAGLGTLGTVLAGGAGATLISRPLESLAEAGGVYNEAIAKGMTEDQAAEAAKSTFLKNLPLAVTDFAEIGAAFLGAKFLPKPLQKTIQGAMESRFGRHVIDPAIKIAAPALIEGGEEVVQDVIQRSSLGDQNAWKWDEQKKQAFGAGAIMGGVMGGAGVITDLKAVQEQASQEQPTPYTPPPLQKPDTTPVSYSGPVLGNIGGGTPPVVPSPSSKQTAIMPYATREERYGTLTDKRGLVTGGEGVSGLPAGTTPATPVYHKGNPVQVVSIPNNEYYIVQDAAGKKMAVAQDEVEVRAEVTQPVVQDTVIPTESTPADKTPAVTDDTEQTAAVTAGVASVPQMGDKPVEDETRQGQATQKEPWQMTKPELAQQKPGENPAAKQELAGEGAKTTGAQPPVPAVAGNKVKQQAVIVRHPDGDGYAVSAGVDRWISGGGGAFGGGSIGKWNTVEGAIKGTSHLNKKDWDIVVSDELKPGAQQDSSRDTADSIRKAYDAVTKMYMDKYGLSEAPEQPILAAEVADEWGKRQGMKPTQARKSFREAVAKLMEEGTAGDIVIGSVRDVNNSLGRITVGGRDIQLGTVYVRTQKAETGEKTEKPAPEKKKGPTPDRVRNVFRGKKGAVRVVFPDVIHAELFAFPSKLKKAAQEGGNIDHEAKRLKHWLRMGEDDNLAAIAQDYHKGVMDAVKDLPAKATYKAQKHEKKVAKQETVAKSPASGVESEKTTPSAGGEIITNTPEFKKWFDDSEVVDKDGSPRIVYHGTDADFDSFKPFSHFGTKVAAEERLKAMEVKSKKLIPAYLSINNPLEVTDWGLVSPFDIANEILKSDGDVNLDMEEVLDSWLTSLSENDLQQVAKNIGFEDSAGASLDEVREGLIYYIDQEMYSTINDIVFGGDIRDTNKAIGSFENSFEIIADALEEEGYDGLFYRNRVEDKGSVSWVIISPEQVKRANGQAKQPSPQQAGVEKKIRANEQAKPPESEVSEVPTVEALKAYAKEAVKTGEIKSVTLVGSAAVKGKIPNDIDLLYDLGDRDLPNDSESAEQEVEEIIEGMKAPIDTETYDTFIQLGDRFFHISSGAGRAVVENTSYAKEQLGKPTVVLAEAEVKEAPSATLADYGLAIKKGTTRNGNPVWEVTGETKQYKDYFNKMGARWYGPKKSWSFYAEEDPTAKILAKLPKAEKKEEAAEVKPETQEQAVQSKYGRAGNAALKKWAANEYVYLDLEKIDDPKVQAFRKFFEFYYNAGMEGDKSKKIFKHPDLGDYYFPPFLEDEFYNAGMKDAETKRGKGEAKAPEPKEQSKFKDGDWISYVNKFGQQFNGRVVSHGVGKNRLEIDVYDGARHQGRVDYVRFDNPSLKRIESPLEEPTATKRPANKQKESLQTGQDSGLERDYPSREKPETKTEPPKSTKVDTSQKAETAVESKQGKAKDIEGWLEKAEQAAWSRLESRKGRLMAGLPMDDLVDYAIIGAAKLARKALNLAEFTASMLEDIKAHFGEEAARKTKPFMPGVYGQAQAMLEMTPDEIEEMIESASREEKASTKEGVGDESRTGSDRDEPSGEGKGPLDEAPSKDVQGTAEEGPTEANPDRSSEEHGAGVGERRGKTKGEKPPTKDGKLPGDSEVRDVGEGHGLGDGEGDVDTAPKRGGRSGTRKPTKPAGSNYVIKESDRLGEGSLKDKYMYNVAAIKLLKQLEEEQRLATPEEQKVLVRYVGWGGMPQVFSYYDSKGWEAEKKEIKELLTDKEYESARESTLNAHYTSEKVITSMYGILSRLGFKGGRILEPAMGSGNFFGLMPTNLSANSRLTGVELDEMTGKLAKQLYQNADIRIEGFEATMLPDGFYDVAISNVPFGSHKLHDPKYNKYNFLIHDYFFAKSLDKVRPGGLVMFITSKGTMDKQDTGVRKYISDRADLIGAIRLPNTAFKGNANTEVTTDIIILQKREDGAEPKGQKWLGLKQIKGKNGEDIMINEYFANNPEMMMGQMSLEGSMYRANEATLESDGRDLGKAILEAAENLPKNILAKKTNKATAKPTLDIYIPAPAHVKQNAYTIKDGKLYIKEGHGMKLVNLPKATEARIKGMIAIRNSVREVLKLQIDNESDAKIKAAQNNLNTLYDNFVKKNGYLNKQANKSAYKSDPDAPLLLALEKYDRDNKTAEKAAIFTKRTLLVQKKIESTDTAKEAMVVALNETGRLDWERMSALTGKTAEEMQKELAGLIYKNPEGDWETADSYLSGNVRDKLAIAEVAAKTDPFFESNVKALKEVQPEDLDPTKINARLGNSWIPTTDIEDFLKHLVGAEEVKVNHAASLAVWTVEVPPSWERSIDTTKNEREWGTTRYHAVQAVRDSLNLRIPTIYDIVGDKTVVNQAATLAAREKQERVKKEFQDWLWTEPERRQRLVQKYNNEMNNTRERVYDGDHLTLPGIAENITLRNHQKNAIWRIIQAGNTMLAHVVGAGKTYTMIAAGMELKRLGLVKKPMYVVPNHLLEQWSAEFLQLYPSANVLMATKDDMSPGKRKQLMSRIATGDWDAVLVTHSGFERIPMSRKAVNEYIKEQIDELTEAILSMKEESGKKDSRIVKELESAKKRLVAKLKARLNEEAKDDTVTFEELGVDQIFVDEAHMYKNLYFTTKMSRVAGIPTSQSNRSQDMFIKTRYISNLNNGAGVVFATGTPISNSMTELYTMQRYLQMQALRNSSMGHFDSWAGTFGESVTAYELTPDSSGYEPRTSFSRFVNLPELVQMFRQVFDVQTADMLNLPIPKVAGGKPVTYAAEATPELKEYVAKLAKRSEAIRSGRVDKRIDNMLSVTNDGRKAALDMRLIDPSASEDPNSKANKMVNKVFEIWNATKKNKSAQLIFCDLSTPKKEGQGFSVYNDVRAKLIEMGIPAKEIAFIHDANTDARKLRLFDDVNAGKVRVLMGSTGTMGAGMNVQQKLIALHHLDAPWRPSDIEQREGRIVRQGNTNEEVQIYRYVTESSFDAYMWQTLERKARFISQIMNGNITVREAEDVDGAALTYAEVKAIASGNPLVLKKMTIDTEVHKLQALKAEHNKDIYDMQDRIAEIPQESAWLYDLVEHAKKDVATRQDTSGDKFKITLGKKTYTERKAAGQKILKLADGLELGVRTPIGKFAGFDLSIQWISGTKDSPERSVRLYMDGSDKESPYETTMSISDIGIIRSLEMTLARIDTDLERWGSHIAYIEKELADLKEQVKKPFKGEEKLNELLVQQAEINRQFAQDNVESGTVTDEDGIEVVPEETGEGDVRYKRNVSLKEISNILDVSLSPAPEAISRPEIKAANTLSKMMTGNDLVLYKGTPAIQGMSIGDIIYLNVHARQPLLYAVKHEVVHALRNTDPEAYAKLMDLVQEYFDGNQEMFKHYKKQGYEAGEVWGEFVSDTVSEVMETDGFWAKVREKAPALIRKIVDILDGIISKYRQAVSKDLSVLRYIKNVEEFRDKVAGVTAESLARAKHRDPRSTGELSAKTKGTKKTDITETPEFRAWFRDSRVVDERGKPLVVYHGTGAEFSAFNPKMSGKNFGREIGYRKGFFFAKTPDSANVANFDKEIGGSPNIIPAYLSLQNPLEINIKKGEKIPGHWATFSEPTSYYDNNAKEINKKARNKKADGVIIKNTDTGEAMYIAYNPSAIKSAIGNRGTWDASNPDIRHKKDESPKLTLPDTEVQERMEKARGVPKDSMREKIKELLTEVYNKGHREYQHLPRTGEFAELRNSLLNLRKQKGISADKTLRLLDDITKPLDEFEYDVFSHKVIFDDLAHEHAEGRALPFGLTEENFQDIKDYIDTEAANLPKVQEAINKRKRAWANIKKDYTKAQKAVGFKVEDRLTKEDYYHHQVLEYANKKGLMRGSRRLRVQTGRGFLRKRGGSELDINTDYLQAEFEVMAQMLLDTAEAKTVKVVKENHDIMQELKHEAVRMNDAAMLEEFQKMLDQMGDTETTPEQMYRSLLNKKQAIAFSQLYAMAGRGELPVDPAGRFGDLVDALAEASHDWREAKINAADMGESAPKGAAVGDEWQAELWQYLNWLAGSENTDDQSHIVARSVFKGIAQKKKAIKNTLGDKYVTWEDLIPEGYTVWQPREGHMFYMVSSVPESMAEQIFYGIMDEMKINAAMLKREMAVGQKYPELVIKEGVALTLEDMYGGKERSKVAEVAYFTPYRAWKQWQLISPRRYFRYNIRNMTGDLDAVIAGNPGALKPDNIKKAWSDLWQAFFTKDKVMSPELKDWFERGGFETLMQAQEINEINRNRQFRHLMESRMKTPAWEKMLKSPATAWNTYWDFARTSTDFREAFLRYAVFLDYARQMQGNRQGKPNNFGASNKDEIMAIQDPKDRAAKLANELLGAYDEVSVIGTWLADHAFPFWRWNEVNFVRYSKLFRNAYRDGKLMAAVAGKTTGLAVRSPYIAWQIGKFVVKAAALTAMITAWNMLLFDDEEKELPEDVRNRLHIIFGRDKDGKVLYFSRLGALQDFVDWFGLDTPAKHVQDYLSGRRSIKEIATDLMKADANKIINALTPVVKTPGELLFDRKLFPDAFSAMPIRDKWQYLFDSIGLGNEYKALAGKPSRGYASSIPDFFLYRSDPYETAYFASKENVRRYQRKIGKYNEGYSESIRSDALYNIKLSMRYGDKEAARKYLIEFIKLGGTEKGFKQSMRSLDPLSGLSKDDRKPYFDQLDAIEKENLAKAYQYYLKVIGGEMFLKD